MRTVARAGAQRALVQKAFWKRVPVAARRSRWGGVDEGVAVGADFAFGVVVGHDEKNVGTRCWHGVAFSL